MDKYDIGLMKLFRERDNRDPNEARIGKVISTGPIKVSLFGGAVIFTENDENAILYVCEGLKNKNINNGDNVLCIPLSRGQSYVAVDRV
jgi:hypothetical protein